MGEKGRRRRKEGGVVVEGDREGGLEACERGKGTERRRASDKYRE